MIESANISRLYNEIPENSKEVQEDGLYSNLQELTVSCRFFRYLNLWYQRNIF